MLHLNADPGAAVRAADTVTTQDPGQPDTHVIDEEPAVLPGPLQMLPTEMLDRIVLCLDDPRDVGALWATSRRLQACTAQARSSALVVRNLQTARDLPTALQAALPELARITRLPLLLPALRIAILSVALLAPGQRADWLARLLEMVERPCTPPVWRTRLRELIAAVERLDGQPQEVEAALAAFELLLAEARGLHPRAQRRLYLAVAQAFSAGALGDAYHRTEKTNQAVSRIFRRLLALVQDWSLKTECGLQMTEALLASPPYFPLRDRQALHIALLETLHGTVTGGTELHAA